MAAVSKGGASAAAKQSEVDVTVGADTRKYREITAAESGMKYDGMATFTEEELKALEARGDTTVYEYHGREIADPMSDKERERSVALLRSKYADMLSYLPEASDAQLRHQLLKETPALQRLFNETVALVRSVTCRRMKRSEFVRMFKTMHWIHTKKEELDQHSFQLEYIKYMEENKLEFQSLEHKVDYMQNNVITMEPLSVDLLALLERRRVSGEKPGVELLND